MERRTAQLGPQAMVTVLRPVDTAFISEPTGGACYLVGDFEDWMTEVGKRVLLADIDQNDWHVSPWPELDQKPIEMTCPRCHGSGKVTADG